MLISHSIVLATLVAQQVYAATITSSGYAPQFSPIFPNLKAPTGVVTSYSAGPYDTSTTLSYEKLEGFPEPWKAPPTELPEVRAAYNSIDWSKVPKAPVRKQTSDGSWVSSSDGANDPYCWWSSTNCLTPRVSYLPPDIYTCPNKGDWGLNHDDGPFNRYTDSNADKENPYAEPALYNFLATHNAYTSLFYIGSNVANYPAAAKRGLNNGHHLCVHSWSHPPLTTQTNAQIVAEFYWTLKAIKAATGVTSKCFRPPQGDVDDRVRAIAWQMGMRNILWDQDTNDWAMPAPGGGNLSPKKVDAFFQERIDSYKSGKDSAGHIVLQHETNSATVNMTMFWLPRLQNVFNVIPALACNGITQPYWETNFVYPISNPENPPATFTSKPPATTTPGTKTSATPTPTNGACVPGSFGLGFGDGYNGYCCKTEQDCLDNCLSGSCNGIFNPVKTTITNVSTAKPTTTKTTTTKTTTKTPTKTPTKTTTKTASKTTTKKPTTSCIAGVSGKKNGSGKTGYCCTSSDDCLAVCRSGTCNI
ncbi:hypothetical protein EDC94DRAFT_555415 [Helicostylum pulchrum]|uniref:NodB homology domain-containing protein n=1 Tax=Helicostylum pulchrum TaxID=562976 RepID=A0ABP9XYU4_9FUNG|nr:hypothetical protein EDC94DRAFT_555415 [Helicostylum pulchrum]